MSNAISQELEDAVLKLHALETELGEIRRRESALTTDHRLAELLVLDLLHEAGLTAATLDNGLSVAQKMKTVYNVAPGQWPTVYARVAARGEWELLQKRLSSTAVRERFAAGDQIEGIIAVTIPELKLAGGLK